MYVNKGINTITLPVQSIWIKEEENNHSLKKSISNSF